MLEEENAEEKDGLKIFQESVKHERSKKGLKK